MSASGAGPRDVRGSTSPCRSRGEQRPPIHDGDHLRLRTDLQKKALTEFVDCVRSAVADPDLCGEQRLRIAVGHSARRVKGSGHHVTGGRHEEQLLAVSSPARIPPAITRNRSRGILVREWPNQHFVAAGRVRLVRDHRLSGEKVPLSSLYFELRKSVSLRSPDVDIVHRSLGLLLLNALKIGSWGRDVAIAEEEENE